MGDNRAAWGLLRHPFEPVVYLLTALRTWPFWGCWPVLKAYEGWVRKSASCCCLSQISTRSVRPPWRNLPSSSYCRDPATESSGLKFWSWLLHPGPSLLCQAEWHLSALPAPFPVHLVFLPPLPARRTFPSWTCCPSALVSLHLQRANATPSSDRRSNVSSAVTLSLALPDGISSLCDPRIFSHFVVASLRWCICIFISSSLSLWARTTSFSFLYPSS